jgi:adhesin transport system outer membrane protein
MTVLTGGWRRHARYAITSLLALASVSTAVAAAEARSEARKRVSAHVSRSAPEAETRVAEPARNAPSPAAAAQTEPALTTTPFAAPLPIAPSPTDAGEAGLYAAISATLRQHPLLAARRASVESKRFGTEAVRAQQYPTLSVTASAADNGTNPGALRLRQPLWTFGRISSQIGYAEADRQLEEADLQRAIRDLTEQSAVAYARVVGAQMRLAIAETNLATMRELHGSIVRRERGKLASAADVRLSSARLAQALTQREQFFSEVAITRNELFALTRSPVDTGPPVPENLLEAADPLRLEQRAFDRNAEIQYRIRSRELAAADLEQVRRSPMPTVYLQADQPFGQTLPGVERRVSVVIDGNLDGMGFAASARTRAAASRLQSTEQSLEVARNDITRALRTLHAQQAQFRTQVDSIGRSIDSLQQTLESYRRQYEAGYKAWLDVLNFQRELTEQRLAQAQARIELTVQSLRLRALVGDLDPDAPPAAGN